MPDSHTGLLSNKAKVYDRDVTFTTAADLGAYIGNVSETTRNMVYSQAMQLFAGAAGNDGSHIWDYLKDGQVMFRNHYVQH